MMEDFYQNGFDNGYGRNYLNDDHEMSLSDGEQYDYRVGRADGERRRRICDELDNEDI